MDNQNTCPTCGNPIDATMKFCRTCGTDLRAKNVQPTPETKTNQTCSKCGTASKPGQKYCSKCGTPLDTVAIAGTAAGTAAGAVTDSLNDVANRSKTALDDFMGRSVDTTNVGAGFDPRTHTLQAAGNAGLKAAFDYFQKPYTPASKNEGAQPVPNIVRRAKAEEEMRAQEQAKRDFSKTSGEGAHYGSFAASLSDAAMPTVDMIAGSRAKAVKNEQLNRLKHQVAMGETTMAEAVKQV